jgi:hypothetical protein
MTESKYKPEITFILIWGENMTNLRETITKKSKN